MHRIADWLEKLGMSEYVQRFAENRIDFSVLPDLTDQDLQTLGVLLGDRRKMLRAIANLETTEKSAPAAPATVVSALIPAISAAAEATGERRYLTVMFCDLVGSTSISAQLDAEEWRDLVGAYLDAASAAVTEMGGHVAKKLGDGLMALFGYPVAQENDAERAARAALSIHRALADLNRKNAGAGKPALNARVGIETGPVVVDAAGEIYGDAPNIAARVQSLAEPGTIVVTARVQRQVAGLFVVEERGSHVLKGVPEPVPLFRLVRASGGGRRAGQRHLTPLVGRDEEIAMLMRRWERARQGEGQLVLIMGEPGLGKSRLVEEFHARLRETPHTWSEWSCSQLLQNTPLHPIADWGRQRFGGADVPAEERLADLENTLALVKLDAVENAALLAPLLDIPVPQERAPAFPPEELRRRQLAALTNWVMAGARAQPIVLAFEDLQWADPTTLDLLRGIAERGALAPLFVVITARPEFRPQWGTRSHHSTIALSPLDRRQVRDMVAELSARHALAKEIIDSVTERSGGVPLFVEEVTRLLLERSEQGGVQAIPPTLQQSLTARLDRLGPAREVAQIGAVIGRDFSYALLRAAAAIEDPALQAALERLADADILLVQGLPPDSQYRFKHALIQDAAYENLLKSRRQVLHRTIAEILRDNVSAGVAAEPELLAHHFSQAGLTEAAIEWWGKAGQQSLERSALIEGVAQLGKALGQIATLPTTPVLRREEIKLQVTLASALFHVKGYTSPETIAAFERADALIEQAEALGEHPEGEDALLRFSVMYGQWTGNFSAGNFARAAEHAKQCLALAEKQTRSAPLLVAHRLMGGTLLISGQFQAARVHLDRAITLYAPEEHRSLATRFGQDIGVASLVYRSFVLYRLGYPESARVDADEALKYARDLGQAGTLLYALMGAAFFEVVCGRFDVAEAPVEEMSALSEKLGLPQWKSIGGLLRGCIFVATDRGDQATQLIGSGLSVLAATRTTIFSPFGLTWLARAHAACGRVAEAQNALSEALDAVSKTNERWDEAEVLRTAGEIARLGPSSDAARAETY